MPLASGVLLPFAWPPFSVPLLPFVGLVPYLVWLAAPRGTREMVRGSLAFAVPYFVGNLWGMASLSRFTIAGAPGFLGILVLQLATFFLFPVTLHVLQRTGSRLALPVVAPVAWFVSEEARTFGDLSFSWVTLGYAPSEWPILIQHAELVGVWGISIWLVLVNALVAEVFRLRRGGRGLLIHAISLVAALAIPLAYGTVRLRAVEAEVGRAPTIRVAVVQPNVAQRQKWTPEAAGQIFERLNREVAEAEISAPDLVVGPEASFPFAIAETAPRLPDAIAPGRRPLLLGAVVGIGTGEPRQAGTLRYETFSRHRNAVVLADADRRVLARHDKQRLVPVTEQIPFRRVFGFLLPAMRRQFGRFEPGDRLRGLDVPTSDGPVRVGAVICYETMFPDLVRRIRALGSEVLVNVTNDAWFGRTTFPHQHVGFSVLRAIENRVAIVRCANTGISCIVDPTGRTRLATPLFEERVFTAEVPRMAAPKRGSRPADWLIHMAARGIVLMSLLGALLDNRKARLAAARTP